MTASSEFIPSVIVPPSLAPSPADAPAAPPATASPALSAPPPTTSAGWWQLSAQIARAKRAMRALTDLRYQLDIVFPGHYTQGKGRAYVETPLGSQVVRLPVQDSQQQIAVLFAQALADDGCSLHDDPKARPTVVLFYGEEMHLAAMMPHVQRLRRMGFNVVSPEYVGYGMSSGTAAEAGCYAAAETALEYAIGRAEVDSTRLVLMGVGIGAAIAADVAARADVAGVVMLSAFTSMTDLLHWRLPDRTLDALVRHKFPTDAKLAGVRCPVMIAHAEDDQLVPVEMSGRLAGAAAGADVRHVVVPESTLHGPELLGDAAVIGPALREFVDGLRPRQAVTVKDRPTLVMPRPVPMKLAARPTNDPGTPEAWASARDREPTAAAPSRTELREAV